MKQFTFNHNNVEVTVEVVEITLEKSKDNFENYVSSIKYKLLIKNTIESVEPKFEGDPETSLVYWAYGYDDMETSPPNPDKYIDVKDINIEIFYPQIEEHILSNSNKTYFIEKYGSVLGLCESPPSRDYKNTFVQQNISDVQNKDIQYTDIGLAKITL